ncbi:IucA/IucC family siderophore biosynthesis protein [uncultured Abyssibacter sp.]|uniref:IucA/IucC family protein n=1 Tax=uncultured Abyssibacter sp. TaxID=2320202 RepID=UPI0032B2C85A
MNAPVTDRAPWTLANRRMVAKMLGELCYEQALSAELIGPDRYRVPAGPHRYEFSARLTIWDWLFVEPESVTRDGHPADDAARLLIDIATEADIPPTTLGNLLAETANTLLADMRLLRARDGLTADAMAALPDEHQQALLDGHPKAIANKGRLGWGIDEFDRYAPESRQPVRLRWLAVRRELTVIGEPTDRDWSTLLRDSLGDDETLYRAREAAGVDPASYLLLPVHPWQWQRHIQSHYATELARGEIIDLGVHGDAYLPQISLRTLANANRRDAPHLKLPLTVLNTSCYRGIPGQFTTTGPGLSAWMNTICRGDTTLARRGVAVMQEVAGIHVPHRHHADIDGTPYRYRELLGATWRQSPWSLCAGDERPMLMAALFQTDADGRSIGAALIDASGLGAEDWLARLFDAVVVPLYHLLSRYGIGLVAHGQNIVIAVANAVPRRVLLKDFQGDLRLVDGEFPERSSLPPASAEVLTRLPAHYLIHDLLTGHFVTVLRFLSAQLHAERVIDEADFYRVLARVLRDYQHAHPDLRSRFETFDLFRARIERVCINRVRFRVGYDDSAERPVPIVGGLLDNPLALAERAPLEAAS